MEQEFTWERLGNVLDICVSKIHKFGTDAFLLSHFAQIRRKDTACDLGTGCGIIPMLWFRNPENAPKLAYGVDIQPQAIAQLEQSIARNHLEGQLIPLLWDLKEITTSSLPLGMLDLVTCNPPYKIGGTGIVNQNPSREIARHETLCSMEDVVQAAERLLQYGGRFCLCQRPERLCDVLSAMRSKGVEPKRVRFVHKNPQSAPWLFLVEGKKGGKPFLQVEPPLYIQGENGAFSQELQDIYFKF